MARITRLTDTERKYGDRDKYDFLNTESEWFMERVLSKKTKIDMAKIENIKLESQSRCSIDVTDENPAVSIIHLKDICSVMDWSFPRDKEDRNRLAKLSNFLQTVQGANAQQMLWNGMLAVLTREDIMEPTDMFLSQKEARKAKNRKRLEARSAAGLGTPEERLAAKREKGRLRRKSKKLAITVEEVIALEATVETLEPAKQIIAAPVKPPRKSRKTNVTKQPATGKAPRKARTPRAPKK